MLGWLEVKKCQKGMVQQEPLKELDDGRKTKIMAEDLKNSIIPIQLLLARIPASDTTLSTMLA